MFYKEWKHLAAHYVLSILRKQSLIFFNDDKTQSPPTYQWTNIYYIKEKMSFWFSKEILKDAAKMMFIEYKNPDNEVDMLNNSNDEYKSEFKILEKGLTALKDKKYLRLFLKPWKTIIAIFFAAILTIIAVITGLREIGFLKSC